MPNSLFGINCNAIQEATKDNSLATMVVSKI